MSVRFPTDSLTVEEKKKISEDLCIEKVQTRFVGKGKSYSKKSNVTFFQADAKWTCLPFNYAWENFLRPKGLFPNQEGKAVSGSFEMSPGFQLRDYQVEALQYAFQDFEERRSAFFNVFCSFGKTIVSVFCAAHFSQETGTATLVLVPQDGIVKSWIGAFQEHSTAKVALAGKEDDETQVIVCPCHQVDKLKEETKERVGFLIIDEADCYCTPGHVKTLLATRPYYILGCTATYERDDEMEEVLDLLLGRVRINRISLKPFFVLKINTPFSPGEVERTKYGISYPDLVKKIGMNKERNFLILNIVENNVEREKILILTLQIEHATFLHNIIAEYFHYLHKEGKSPRRYTVSRYFDDDKEYKDSDVLIGSYSKMGRGFDQASKAKGWDGRRFNFLILASTTLKVEQLSGRAFRAEVPVVVELIDNHDKIREHWREREEWYRSRNAIIMNIGYIPKWEDIEKLPEVSRLYLQAKERGKKENTTVRVISPSLKERREKEKKSSGGKLYAKREYTEEDMEDILQEALRVCS